MAQPAAPGLAACRAGARPPGLRSVRPGASSAQQQGPLFWIYLAYTQLVVLIACGLLLASFRTRTLRFGPALILTAGLLIPAVTNWLYVFGLTPVCGYDLTPTTLVVTGVLYLLAFRRFRLFDVMPVALRAVLEAMDDPVIVLDMQDRRVDANPAAQATCGLPP